MKCLSCNDHNITKHCMFILWAEDMPKPCFRKLKFRVTSKASYNGLVILWSQALSLVAVDHRGQKTKEESKPARKQERKEALLEGHLWYRIHTYVAQCAMAATTIEPLLQNLKFYLSCLCVLSHYMLQARCEAVLQ